MQINGRLKIQDEVVAMDKTTKDLYKGIRVKFEIGEVWLPQPIWLKDGDKELGFRLQYTSSGTWDLTLERIGKPEELTDDQLDQLAAERVRANRLKEAQPPDPNAVDRNSDEFKEARKEVVAEGKKSKGNETTTTVAARIGKDGELVPDSK